MKHLLLASVLVAAINACFAGNCEYIESCAGRHIEHKVVSIERVNDLIDEGYKIQAYVGYQYSTGVIMVRCKP